MAILTRSIYGLQEQSHVNRCLCTQADEKKSGLIFLLNASDKHQLSSANDWTDLYLWDLKGSEYIKVQFILCF